MDCGFFTGWIAVPFRNSPTFFYDHFADVMALEKLEATFLDMKVAVFAPTYCCAGRRSK